jgi:hypothetical protein
VGDIGSIVSQYESEQTQTIESWLKRRGLQGLDKEFVILTKNKNREMAKMFMMK